LRRNCGAHARGDVMVGVLDFDTFGSTFPRLLVEIREYLADILK